MRMECWRISASSEKAPSTETDGSTAKRTRSRGDGTSPYYQSRQSGDPDWTSDALKGYALKRWVAGSNSKVYDKSNPDKSYGILAADASKKGQERGLSASLAYSTRPNLVVLRGTKGVYLEGFMAENPAFHTVAILDSEDVVCSNVKFSHL